MGLDLSLTGTGIVVVQGAKVSEWRHLPTEVAKDEQECGLLPSGKFRGTNDERIDWIVSNIRGMWMSHLPALTVIEDYSFANNYPGSRINAEIHGIIKNRLFRVSAPYTTLPPRSLKKEATGNGAASKSEMVEAAQAEWAECPPIHDVADAYHLARWAQRNYNEVVQGG